MEKTAIKSNHYRWTHSPSPFELTTENMDCELSCLSNSIHVDMVIPSSGLFLNEFPLTRSAPPCEYCTLLLQIALLPEKKEEFVNYKNSLLHRISKLKTRTFYPPLPDWLNTFKNVASFLFSRFKLTT